MGGIEVNMWENGVNRDTRARKTETIVWNELDVQFVCVCLLGNLFIFRHYNLAPFFVACMLRRDSASSGGWLACIISNVFPK